ncbi:MAG: hypothetical protein OEW98_00170 [Betaproteobacteria bacterium]|nr:hypothetical protein [Betaproteobacteria bacterium]
MRRWLERLIVWLGGHLPNTPDPAWKATGIRPMTVWSYDEALAVRAARAARHRTPRGRRYRRPAVPVAPRPATVVPMRRVK